MTLLVFSSKRCIVISSRRNFRNISLLRFIGGCRDGSSSGSGSIISNSIMENHTLQLSIFVMERA